MAVFKIKKGKYLPILGDPKKVLASAHKSSEFALLPDDFQGVKFKVQVKEGDRVKVGTPLLESRSNPDLKFTSPAGGIVKEIRRGSKRKLLAIVIRKEGREVFEVFEVFSNMEKASKSSLVSTLLLSGLWQYLKQRPFSKIADPSVVPSSIFVRAMDTDPNSANKHFLLQDKEMFFEVGLKCLKILAEGNPLFTCYDEKEKQLSLAIKQDKISQKHQFKGDHPTGNVSTHIQSLDPMVKGKQIWTIEAEHVALLGEFLNTGKIPVERIVALGGDSVSNPQYYKTRVGAAVQMILSDQNLKKPFRLIQGSVLSGETVSTDSYIGYYTSTLTVLSKEEDKEIFGWMKPGQDRHSFVRLFLSKLMPFKKFPMNTKVNGESRALVFSDWYDQFVVLDIYTSFLLKACLAEDIERMEELGILECAPEDFSLCTYACVSKLEVDSIIRKGLELVERES